MPSAKTLLQLGQKAAEAIGTTLGNLGQGIRAYHGSPHDFERFDLSKIGTGEGAQAYGHGLYFAENPATANEYRKALSRPPSNFPTPIPEDVQAALKHLDYGGFDYSGQFLNEIRNDVRLGKDWRANWDVNQTPADRAAANTINRYVTIDKPPPGHTYEVNIHAQPEQFLQWDKPLMEQDPRVLNTVADVAAANRIPLGNSATGETVYRRFDVAGDPNRKFINPSKEAATAALREAGIPGIKYLDQGSRAAGEGSSNYVLFRDDIIDILRKYGLAGAAAPTVAKSLSDMSQE